MRGMFSCRYVALLCGGQLPIPVSITERPVAIIRSRRAPSFPNKRATRSIFQLTQRCFFSCFPIFRFAGFALLCLRRFVVATCFVWCTIRVFPIHVHCGCLSGAITYRRFCGLLCTQYVRLVGSVVRRRREGDTANAFRGVGLYRLRYRGVHFVLSLEAFSFCEGVSRWRVGFVFVGTAREVSRGPVACPTLFRCFRRENVAHVEVM